MTAWDLFVLVVRYLPLVIRLAIFVAKKAKNKRRPSRKEQRRLFLTKSAKPTAFEAAYARNREGVSALFLFLQFHYTTKLLICQYINPKFKKIILRKTSSPLPTKAGASSSFVSPVSPARGNEVAQPDGGAECVCGLVVVSIPLRGNEVAQPYAFFTPVKWGFSGVLFGSTYVRGENLTFCGIRLLRQRHKIATFRPFYRTFPVFPEDALFSA